MVLILYPTAINQQEADRLLLSASCIKEDRVCVYLD